jgi:ABC-type branched-subunit amino acid transport system substrate-binding protein
MKKIIFTLIIAILSSCQTLNDFVQSEEYPVFSSNEEALQEKKQQTEIRPAISKNLQTVDQTEVQPTTSKNLQTAGQFKKKIKVGLLFPFSSKNKDLGWSLFNTATISLFDNDTNHSIELVLIDSESSIKKITKEISDKNIKIIIGPIFSTLAEEIYDYLIENSIIAISLSNNQQLASKLTNKGGIFVSGFLLEQQLDRIISYSIARGRSNISILAPNNQYGLLVTDIAKKMIKAKDGNVITTEIYDPSSANLDKAVKRVVSAFIAPDYVSEGGKKKLKKDEIKLGERLFADAILVPESGKNLPRISALIKQHNENDRDIKLLGTSQWDDVQTLNDQDLLGSWLPAPDRTKFKSFEKIYYQTFNRFPPRISSIVYDSLASIAELVNRADGRALSLDDFVNYSSAKNGFEGIDGLFRYLPNGLTQRNFAVLEVDRGGFITTDSPAEKFLKY